MLLKCIVVDFLIIKIVKNGRLKYPFCVLAMISVNIDPSDNYVFVDIQQSYKQNAPLLSNPNQALATGDYQQQAYQVPIQPISSTTETIKPIPTYYQPQVSPIQPATQNQTQVNESFIPQQPQQPQQPFIPQQQGTQPQGNQQQQMFGFTFMNDPAMANAVQSYINTNYGQLLLFYLMHRQYMVGRRVALGNKQF